MTPALNPTANTTKKGLLPGNAGALEAHHPTVARQVLAGVPASPCPQVMDDPRIPFSLRIGHASLHNTADPVTEARGLVASSGVEKSRAVIVFGFGAGYVVEAACHAAPADGLIYLVVLDPAAFMLTLSHRDLSSTLADRRLRILVGDLRAVVTSMPQVDESLVVLTHEPVLLATAPELEPLAGMARELSATQRSRRSQFGDVLDNIEHNLERILACGSVRDLAPKLAGRPALLVAPGPSLDGQLDLLASRPLPLLVSLDTSLRPLNAAKVTPDLAVTLDPTPGNVAKFEGITLPCPLVFFGGSRPEALARAPDAVFACEEDGLLDRAHPWFGRGGRFRSGGSVLLAALDVLLAAGSAPIVLVGADLAHTNGMAHAGAAQRHGLTTNERLVRRRGGGTIPTSESLWRHARRLNRRLAQLPPGLVLDATADGAELSAATRVDLDAWLSQLPPPDQAVSLASLQFRSVAPPDAEVIRDAAIAAIAQARP